MNATPNYGEYQRKKDNDHINLLSIFHFVVSGLSLCGIGFIPFHYMMMRTIFMNPAMWQNQRNPPPPEFREMFMKLFICLYIFLGILVVAMCVLNLLSGIFLRQRKHRVFSLVVAGIDCLQIPVGTALGVFTIVVLTRDSVREAYDMAGKPGAPA